MWMLGKTGDGLFVYMCCLNIWDWEMTITTLYIKDLISNVTRDFYHDKIVYKYLGI